MSRLKYHIYYSNEVSTVATVLVGSQNSFDHIHNKISMDTTDVLMARAVKLDQIVILTDHIIELWTEL